MDSAPSSVHLRWQESPWAAHQLSGRPQSWGLWWPHCWGGLLGTAHATHCYLLALPVLMVPQNGGGEGGTSVQV